MKYIGRKILTSKRKKILKGKVKRVISASDWKDYFGSSEQMKLYILTNGKNSVKREILRLCNSKSEMAYFESKEIFVRDALLKDEYINKWITCQISGNNLRYLKKDVDYETDQNTPDSSQSKSLQTDIE